MSVGRMDAGLSLAEISPLRRADVVTDEIVSAKEKWSREHRRPRTLTARDALVALQFEALFVWTCAANLRDGAQLFDEDYERLTLSCRRLETVIEEALK